MNDFISEAGYNMLFLNKMLGKSRTFTDKVATKVMETWMQQ